MLNLLLFGRFVFLRFQANTFEAILGDNPI
ncbi:hypothetical protein J2Z57_000721 [Formosa algae]|uniref:Uncharacterized protein n=1 Tax=Formosa algae TaxID=225843 RepID=A0A9X1CAJ6_9FLAO|nr:hypothetical protein [Formosa algae]MDQ0334294.1 hypothetical protein [Formosa algae]